MRSGRPSLSASPPRCIRQLMSTDTSASGCAARMCSSFSEPIAEEMVGLITAQRYFQANAKAIDTATQLSQTVINLRT